MTTSNNDSLGNPGFIVNDGLHGNRFDTSTLFPVRIVIASTFDRDLAFRVGKAISSALGATG